MVSNQNSKTTRSYDGNSKRRRTNKAKFERKEGLSEIGTLNSRQKIGKIRNKKNRIDERRRKNREDRRIERDRTSGIGEEPDEPGVKADAVGGSEPDVLVGETEARRRDRVGLG